MTIAVRRRRSPLMESFHVQKENRRPAGDGRAASECVPETIRADDITTEGNGKPASLTDLSISDVVASDDVQMRVVGLDPTTVASYSEDMRAGVSFPAITVFHDGVTYHLADGFHRLEAARRIGRETILAEVWPGTSRDALLAACSANAKHGLRRTNEDKRRAVTAVLKDPEFGSQSDRAIGKLCLVDHKTVASIRRDLTEPKSGEIPISPKTNGKPSGAAGGAGMVEKMLATITDDALLAECRRRGWAVHHDV